MSSVEMYSHVSEAAQSAPSTNWKDRVQAAARVLNLPFGRAKAFYYREPRRVTAEEMDHARAAIRELREARRREREREHLLWLESEIGRLRASGEEFHGVHIDALLSVVRASRGEAGTVAVSPEGE